MNKILFVILFYPFIVQSQPQLQLYGQTRDVNFYYIPETVSRKGNTVSVWEVMSFNKNEKDEDTGKMFRSIRGLYEYDCVNKTHRNLSETLTTLEKGSGTVIRNQTVTFGWKYVDPLTPVSEIFKIVCK